MEELIEKGRNLLDRILTGENRTKKEKPRYIGDNYNLLGHVDPHLHTLIDQASLRKLQTSLKREKTFGAEVVDLGAGRNFLRGLVFFECRKTIAVDPAYKWYDYSQTDSFATTPYPRTIFGGQGERQLMEELLRYACYNLSVPGKIEPNKATSITGERKNQPRSFELHPEDATTWLRGQRSQTLANFVVYRVFPSPDDWGRILSSLKEGGVLLTTGYGKIERKPGGEALQYEPDISQGGGLDVDNSPLPANGRTEVIGLIPIAQIGQVNFYRKTKHLEPSEISQLLEENQ